jgi:outer membrane protein TolC
MTRVRAACERVDQAVTQLSQVVETQSELAGNDRDEVVRLEEDLQAARAAYASLREATETVSARLDETIGRLKRVLGE